MEAALACDHALAAQRVYPRARLRKARCLANAASVASHDRARDSAFKADPRPFLWKPKRTQS